MQRSMKTVAAAAALARAAQLMSVPVRNGQFRDKPGFSSKVVGELEYGNRVDLTVEKATGGRSSPWATAGPAGCTSPP